MKSQQPILVNSGVAKPASDQNPFLNYSNPNPNQPFPYSSAKGPEIQSLATGLGHNKITHNYRFQNSHNNHEKKTIIRINQASTTQKNAMELETYTHYGVSVS